MGFMGSVGRAVAVHKNIEAPHQRRRIECLEEAQLYAAV